MPDLHGWSEFADSSGFADLKALHEQAMAAAFAEWHAEVDQILLYGNGTGEMSGFLAREPEREPTPAERALAILDPHLRACPLYNAGPPVLYPANWKTRP